MTFKKSPLLFVLLISTPTFANGAAGATGATGPTGEGNNTRGSIFQEIQDQCKGAARAFHVQSCSVNAKIIGVGVDVNLANSNTGDTARIEAELSTDLRVAAEVDHKTEAMKKATDKVNEKMKSYREGAAILPEGRSALEIDRTRLSLAAAAGINGAGIHAAPLDYRLTYAVCNEDGALCAEMKLSGAPVTAGLVTNFNDVSAVVGPQLGFAARIGYTRTKKVPGENGAEPEEKVMYELEGYTKNEKVIGLIGGNLPISQRTIGARLVKPDFTYFVESRSRSLGSTSGGLYLGVSAPAR